MNDIAAKNESFALAPVLPRSEMQIMVDMVERMMLDKDLDFARVKEAVDLLKSIRADAAKMAFNAALARAQPLLPVIGRNGEIIIRNKEDRQKGLPIERQRIEQKTKFADWADINEAVTPIISTEGLSLGFDSVGGHGDTISVTCYLRHSGGHEQKTTLVLPHDTTGSKNPAQAIGSSLSYGKRYTAGLLLNFVSRAAPEGDNDGKSSDERVQTIGSDKTKAWDVIQYCFDANPGWKWRDAVKGIQTDGGTVPDALEQALSACGADLKAFKEYFSIETLDDLPLARLEEAMTMIARKTAAKAKFELANAKDKTETAK